jgi:hypothetical protein
MVRVGPQGNGQATYGPQAEANHTYYQQN